MNIIELTNIHDIREGDVVVANYVDHVDVGVITDLKVYNEGLSLTAEPFTKIEQGKITSEEKKNIIISGEDYFPQSAYVIR